jgi:hypothetical protein
MVVIGHTSRMLVRPHLSIAGTRRDRVTKANLSLLDDVVALKVLDALRAGSRALTDLGVRHVIVGGLAVGANGYPRATKDVDFLVGDEAFERHSGGFVTMRPGVPIQINGVAIDLLSVGEGEDHLAAALAAPPGTVIEAAPLIYMKLKSPRQKDRVDVIELVKAGADIEECRRYLQTFAAGLVAAFDEAVARAAAEE